MISHDVAAKALLPSSPLTLSPVTGLMQTKQHIVENWLPRYTGTELDGFGKYILLTNFDN